MTAEFDPYVIWCAGFFDGEGSISIPRANRKTGSGILTKNQMWLQINITQNQKPPLLSIKELFGGRVVICHQPASKKLLRPIWRWVADGPTAAKFLIAVRPYLRIKGVAADIALRFQTTVGNSGHVDNAAFVMAARVALKAELEAANRAEHAI